MGILYFLNVNVVKDNFITRNYKPVNNVLVNAKNVQDQKLITVYHAQIYKGCHTISLIILVNV